MQKVKYRIVQNIGTTTVNVFHITIRKSIEKNPSLAQFSLLMVFLYVIIENRGILLELDHPHKSVYIPYTYKYFLLQKTLSKLSNFVQKF